MSVEDEDKTTVVLDLNAIKKQKLKQEEELASMVQGLEFAVGPDESASPKPSPANEALDSENFAETFLKQREDAPAPKQPEQKENINFTVILFDFQSDFFQQEKSKFPTGFNYQVATTLPELNKLLSSKKFQIVIFNYDTNPKAVNQLTAQIKQKFPVTKTIIMARTITPDKAKLHAQTPSGANGYYQLPLDTQKIEKEFLKIYQSEKKV